MKKRRDAALETMQSVVHTEAETWIQGRGRERMKRVTAVERNAI